MSELETGERYFLRGCRPGGRAYGGFAWPLDVGAVVTAPDWDPTPKRGGGLHGNLDGGGDALALVNDGPGMVVAARDAVDLGGQHKFRECRILYVGTTLRDAAAWLATRVSTPVNYAIATAGDQGTATAGDYGTATAGYRGIATAGHCGTATADDQGIATAGYRGIATAGSEGIATAGSEGIATAGYRGAATAGDRGTATAGVGGTATAGVGGCVVIRHRDDTVRCRAISAEDAGKRWRLTDEGEFEVVP